MVKYPSPPDTYPWPSGGDADAEEVYKEDYLIVWMYIVYCVCVVQFGLAIWRWNAALPRFIISLTDRSGDDENNENGFKWCQCWLIVEDIVEE